VLGNTENCQLNKTDNQEEITMYAILETCQGINNQFQRYRKTASGAIAEYTAEQVNAYCKMLVKSKMGNTIAAKPVDIKEVK